VLGRFVLEQLKLAIEPYDNAFFGCLVDGKDRLVSSAFGSRREAVQSHLVSYSKGKGSKPVRAEHSLTREMIRLYEGKDTSKPARYNLEWISDFQRGVYRILGEIPRGRVTTYGLIAKRLGSAPRAVGRAVASNPLPLFVPCERVVNFDLTVGNYGLCGSLGPAGTITKRGLLERENVPMHEGGIERKAVWDPSRNKR
jgi:methylated-DNA-[protein]-cysteine S-methyltransferase